MLQITPQMRILVAVEPVDGRKGIDSPVRLCQQKPGDDPFSGCLFIFRTRGGTVIKLLIYDAAVERTISETDADKVKKALHALVDRLTPQPRTTEKTAQVVESITPVHQEESRPPAPGHGRNGAAASTQWELVRDEAELMKPVHNALIEQAAQGQILHNDDTGMRVPALERPEDDTRTGTFTSGVISAGSRPEIALYFTDIQHAGENLRDVLKHRSKESKTTPYCLCKRYMIQCNY